MTAKQREQLPSPQYRAEYNNFRKLALEALPEEQKSMPPAVDDDVQMEEGSVARYVEIQTYVEQIFGLLINATSTEAPRVVGDEMDPCD